MSEWWLCVIEWLKAFSWNKVSHINTFLCKLCPLRFRHMSLPWNANMFFHTLWFCNSLSSRKFIMQSKCPPIYVFEKHWLCAITKCDAQIITEYISSTVMESAVCHMFSKIRQVLGTLFRVMYFKVLDYSGESY
jgi:hypothetical protein